MPEFASLEGKTALVTGGSRGIGAAVARELAQAGATVVVGFRSGAKEAEAGITRDGVLARMTDDDWRSVLETNLSSVFYTCRAVSRGMMKRRGGSIVNLSSIVGLHGNWGQSNYAASKGGIVGFTKSLAQELGSRGVRANVVAPGYIKTQLTDAIPEEAQQQMLGLTPLGRFGEPEDVARAVRFLSSDDASFITGEVVVVGGGLGM